MTQNISKSDSKSFRDQLEAWLPTIADGEDKLQLHIHLGDIHDACLHTISLLDRLIVTPVSESHFLRRTLAELVGELYEHTMPHLQQLKPTLEKCIDRLYEEAEQKGEL